MHVKRARKRGKKKDSPRAEKSDVVLLGGEVALSDSFHYPVDLCLSSVSPHLFSLNESQRSRIGFGIVCTGIIERPVAFSSNNCQAFRSARSCFLSHQIRPSFSLGPFFHLERWGLKTIGSPPCLLWKFNKWKQNVF